MISSTKVLSRKYLTEFLDAYEYEDAAKDALLESLDRLIACTSAKEKINALLGEYVDAGFDFKSCCGRAAPCFEEAGVGRYQGDFILIAHLASTLRQLYADAGIADSIWFDSMRDLKFKAKECFLVKKQWGTFVSSWYSVFLNLSTFALGRLQFQKRAFGEEFNLNGVALTPETPALYVHIPRSEEPLTPESVHRSYQLAKEFFADTYFGDKPCVICCSSWLLFPEHENMLKPEANIRHFMNDFTRVLSKDNSDYTFVWRLFDTEYTGDIDALPNDTTLRRAYIERMKKGLPLGSALGVFII